MPYFQLNKPVAKKADSENKQAEEAPKDDVSLSNFFQVCQCIEAKHSK